MHFPADLSTWLKLIGSVFAGLGSLLLAWRAGQLLKWIVYSLVTHEKSIEHLLDLPSPQPRLRQEAVVGALRHLLEIEAKLGFRMFVVGLVFLGIGLLANALSFLV